MKFQSSGEAMENICLVNLAGDEKRGYIIGSQMPQTNPAYSENLDIGYNHGNIAWLDETSHYHKNCEEYFIVLNGQLNLRIHERQYCIHSGQLMGIRSKLEHQIIGCHFPIEIFQICAPGGKNNNNLMPIEDSRPPISKSTEPILLDLCPPYHDYPLGGCLPENHANYSPFLDFTCVRGVVPEIEWRNERLHFHTMREEYYIVLKGRLDFVIESAVVSVYGGQVLGIKPKIMHKVIGGKGPVDILFLRVPGGRGDKIIVEK